MKIEIVNTIIPANSNQGDPVNMVINIKIPPMVCSSCCFLEYISL